MTGPTGTDASSALALSLIEDAYAEGASAIHVEPHAGAARVRFRIDSDLAPRTTLSREQLAALVDCLRGMGGLGPDERRGRIEVRRFAPEGPDLDLEVAIWPLVSGERCVLRLLCKGSIAVGLDEMGFSERNLGLLERALDDEKAGVILFAGPRGSGSVATLYSALSRLDTDTRSVVTAGGDCAVAYDRELDREHAALADYRAMDVDVIALADVAEPELARLAFEMALSGKTVLARIYADDFGTAIARLREDLGVSRYAVASCLRLVCAQRLCRRVCRHCKTASPRGCDRCGGTGLKGRIAIHEVAELDETLRQAIRSGAPPEVLQAAAMRSGMKTMRDDELAKVDAGLTPSTEV